MNSRTGKQRAITIVTIVMLQLAVLGATIASIGGFEVGGNRPIGPGLGGFETQETVEKSMDVSQSPLLSIDNPVGSVIVKSWGKPQVRVEAVKKAYADSEENAQLALKDIEISLTERDGVVRVETMLPHPPSAAFSFPSRRFVVDYFIAAPAQTEIVGLHVIRGTANISGIAGPIRQVTASGTVRVEDSKAEMEIRSTRGAIHLQGVEGKLFLRAGGEIQIKDATGVTVDSSNSKGSFSFVGRLSPGAENLILTQGSSSFTLPPDSDLDLNLEARKGEVRIDFPGADFRSSSYSNGAEDQKFKGIIGKPGTVLQVLSSSGGISIQEQR